MVPWRVVASLLILSATGLHLLYLTSNCPLDLAPDEAHYWDWSRHLDWSYYSKGPLVAYLIRGSVVAFGSWSERLIGNEMAAVRLPAVLCSGLLLISLYVLTIQVFRSEALATAVVAVALTLPVVSVGASLMTIDAPYTCCWGWALVLGYRAIESRSTGAWFAAGLIVGLGILAKYTMILWMPVLGLFLVTNAERRAVLFRPGFWVMTGTAAACCLPIMIWNARHEWISFRHLVGQAGFEESFTGIRWLGPFEYVGGQFLFLMGVWFVGWVLAMWVHRPRFSWAWITTTQSSGFGPPDKMRKCPAGNGIAYLWWMSISMFLVFLVFSLNTKVQLNWPVTAYLSGIVLTVAWVAERMKIQQCWQRRFTAGWLTIGCVLGLSGTVLIHHFEWLYPFLTPYAYHQGDGNPPPLRRVDPTARLRGWRTLAGEVDRIRNQLRTEGVEAELAGLEWILPGELGFYCQGHPQVYSLGVLLSDRHSQYDVWRPNPVADGKQFAGKTFIIVGDPGSILPEMFWRVEPTSTVIHYQDGQPVSVWKVTVCREFRGCDELMAKRWENRY